MSEKKQEPIVDPEFKALIPPLSSEEYKELEASILNYGCLHDLITWNGILLDGHNRFEICSKHNKPFKTQPIVFPDRQAAAQWMIKNQLGRRNLNEVQRGMMAARLANIQHGSNRFAKKVDAPIGGSTPISIDQAAKELNVGSRTAERAKKVLTQGSKELIEACDRGEVSASRAAAVTDLPKDKQLEAAKNKIEPKQETKKEETTTKEKIKEMMRNATCAMAFARDAINFLRKITKDDPKRAEALEQVRKWLDENK